MDRQNTRKAIEEFSQKLKQRFGKNLLQIKIFGSVAREKETPASDIDVFLLFNKISFAEKHEISQIAFDIDLKYDVFLSPVIFTLKQYNNRLFKASAFSRNLEKEGIAV